MALQGLEKKLAYEDLRFYRSIARSDVKKDLAARKQMEEEKKKQQPAADKGKGWGAWIWGSSGSSNATKSEDSFDGTMTEQQRKELYKALDYDEKSALAESFQAPRDALKARVGAQLKKGSFALRTDPTGEAKEVVSIVFDVFKATMIQRQDNLEASISLNDFSVFDGTTSNTLYPQIVRVARFQEDPKLAETKDEPEKAIGALDDETTFFFAKFENNPLDERADTALTVRMRHMEILYHRGYVEAIVKFFKPPESQLESVEALLDVASQTLEDLQRQTRAGLEYALQNHKTIDLQVDMNAPIIIIPER